ncbi:MAG: hypothetical protein OER90_16575 [Gemmatimonadota bacterium]|nr:hypothetical protein [Gemmatimonadota bacterium]MDH3458459.1 hypothetical protein [Gemmatimonadota bacterium]
MTIMKHELIPVPTVDIDRAQAFDDPDGNSWALQQIGNGDA